MNIGLRVEKSRYSCESRSPYDASSDARHEKHPSGAEAIIQSDASTAAQTGGSGREAVPILALRAPTVLDGAAITRLISRCPPLDANSAYCNLLQCTDFADTCVVAERDGRIVGWISAYIPPAAPDRVFVWQVAVDPEARGLGLGGRMLDELLGRKAVRNVRFLTTTVTNANAASWAMFGAFAQRRGAAMEKLARFDRDRHLGGAAETEWEALIGPLDTVSLKQTQEVA